MKGKYFTQRTSQLNLCLNPFILIVKSCKQLQMISGRPAEASHVLSLGRPVGMITAAAWGFMWREAAAVHIQKRPSASVAASVCLGLAHNLERHW